MGQSFKTVWFVSFDGVRLRVVYGVQRKVATIYLGPPSSELYQLGEMSRLGSIQPNRVWRSSSQTFVLDSVLKRKLERLMLRHGSTYDTGRLGAELSYVIARTKFRLPSIILVEPSAGGRDLYTDDGSVAIQSRLLKDLPKWKDETLVRVELMKLVSKLMQVSKYNTQMRRGLAILSREVGDGVIRSLIWDLGT